jgi:hypothetical protein
MEEFDIICKILKILLRAMKEEDFNGNIIKPEEFGINRAHFENIILMLKEKGYVSGVYEPGMYILYRLNLRDIKLTFDGLCYLQKLETTNLSKRKRHNIG